MDYYSQIKDELVNNEVYKTVKDYSKNRSDLQTYYNVGKLLSEAGKHYGEGIIKKYSERLIVEVKKKYNERTLRRMRQFYEKFKNEKWSTVSTKLTWSHYVELLSIDNMDEVVYYINICRTNNIDVRDLRNKIKNKEYERLPESTKNKLINNDDITLPDMVKNPIIIKNKYNTDKISEKVLQQLILEDLPSFLKELGNGFSFIDNEYKIKIGNNYNYIDLLLYNIKYKSYVVVELKVTELKKEHIGQIEVYMNYIDSNIKDITDNKTIGIIICKEENSFVIKYASDNRILQRKYILN